MPTAESNPIDDNTFANFFKAVKRTLDGPVVWFRETIVVPNQKQYNWYHRRYRRVPTVDECYERDAICIWEADRQYERDKMVDQAILSVLRFRYEDCMHYESPDALLKCRPLKEIYEENVGNYFAKYGDMHVFRHSKTALMKQKHRMLWERRYGPVGTGNTPKEQVTEKESEEE